MGFSWKTLLDNCPQKWGEKKKGNLIMEKKWRIRSGKQPCLVILSSTISLCMKAGFWWFVLGRSLLGELSESSQKAPIYKDRLAKEDRSRHPETHCFSVALTSQNKEATTSACCFESFSSYGVSVYSVCFAASRWSLAAAQRTSSPAALSISSSPPSPAASSLASLSLVQSTHLTIQAPLSDPYYGVGC